MEKFNLIKFTERLLKEQEIIFIPQMGFFRFEDGVWQKVDEQFIRSIIQKKLGEASTKHYINEIVEAIKNTTITAVNKLNNNRNRLVLLNGTLDLSDWSNPSFYEGTFFKEDYSTVKLNCNYDGNARSPEFKNYLETTFDNDKEMVFLIAEMLGYCLTTSTKFQKSFILYGTGSNGKSVFLNIIEKLLTYSNIASVSMSDLGKAFSRSSINGRLVNISSELEGYVQETDYFKKIVSGDLIDAQYKFKDIFEFKPYCKLLFAMNTLPKTKDKTDGFYRRLIIIPFDKTFSEEQQDKTLNAKLEKELDGILQVALHGLKRLAKYNKFTMPSKVTDMLNHYKFDSSPISQFAEDYLVLQQDEKIQCEILYQEYNCFCQRNGYKPLNFGNFGKELRRIYPEIKKERLTEGKQRKNFYLGLTLLNKDGIFAMADNI